nr:hypothetical protein BaRGS_033394 [Batillaria attramentaria]
MVTGTLLVTPNAIMFDPDMRDLLVKENGPDGYGVVIYFETILSAALYHDLSAMRYHTRTSSEREVMERPAIYHADLRPRDTGTFSTEGKSSDDRQEKGAEEAGGVETESGTQEGEEMRIGNIVYLPVEESSSGEMIVRGSSDDLIPVAPTQEATELNLDDEDGSARDAVDGAGSMFHFELEG